MLSITNNIAVNNNLTASNNNNLTNNNNNIVINNNNCLSVKSKSESNKQCPHAKKVGNFCGIHNKVVQKNGVIVRIDTPPTDTHRTLIHVSFRKNEDGKDKEKSDSEKGESEKKCCGPSEPEFYDDLQFINSIPVESLNYAKIIKTLRHLEVQISGNKEQLVSILKKTLKEMNLIKLAYDDPIGKCNNNADFYDFVDLDKIPKEYLFIFMCSDNMLYGMDIRSMHSYFQELERDARLMEKPVEYKNPYNRQFMSSKTICAYRSRVTELNKNGFALKYPDEEHDPQDKMTFRVLEIFHTIYNYGYAVDASWFLKMTRQDLLNWYWVMEDVWNRRLGLTSAVKRNIVPADIHIFNRAEYYNIREKSLIELQNIMIEKIDKMVNSGIDRDNRINGIHYVLIGITEVCEVETAAS
jgi:hypothetical protein